MKYSFEDEVDKCLSGEREKINVRKTNHIEISKVLHRLSYSEKHRGQYLPITYSETSSPFLFPLGRLEKASNPDKSILDTLVRVTVGTMSLRHHELDFIVDFYLVLNSGISNRNLSGLEQQERAYQETKKQIEDDTFNSGAWIKVIQTGLQPVCVGVYQAIEEYLFRRRRFKEKQKSCLVFEPMIYSPPKGHKDKKLVITSDTHGTKLDDYESLDIWQ